MYDGRFNTDLKHDTNGIVRPYALSLFHPAPRDVLMIGLSSGSWAQVIANNPDVASLTVIEINPGYLKLIAQEPEVASLLTNPKVTIVTDDGRRWLRAQSRTGFRRHRLEHDMALPRQRHQPALGRVPRPGAAPSQSGRHLLLQHHQFRARAAHRLPRLRAWRALHQPHGGVGSTPIAWDFQRWRRTLEAYRIDGRPVRSRARRRIARCSTAWRPEASLTSAGALRRAADRALPRHPRPHRRQAAHHRRQYGQRVAAFPGARLTARSRPASPGNDGGEAFASLITSPRWQFSQAHIDQDQDRKRRSHIYRLANMIMRERSTMEMDG